MADNGLLLNFAAGDLPVSRSAPKLKGGAWRERAKLRRATKDPIERSTGTTDSPNRIPLASRQPQERANKRRKLSNETENPYRHLNREVISSLFTYNPAPQTATEEKQPEDEASEAVMPSNAPLPDGIHTFTTLGLSDTVAAHLLTKMGLDNPTAIQKAAISQLTKEDGDVFIQSETGSGKTLAYLLPIVQRIVTMAERQEHESDVEKLHRDSGLFAIVLAPTRELCKQISVVLEKLLGCAHYVVAGTVIGGEKKKSEKARLRKGLNILVATPGRLVDHLQNTQTLDVSKVRYLVLDEGDRLMDLGFEDDISTIVKHLDDKKEQSDRPGLPSTRINILCSATLRANVEKLGNISLKDATLVKGSSDADEHSPDDDDSPFLAPAQLKQSYVITAAKLRFVTLVALLRRTFARKGSVMKAIVFLSCADSVDFHQSVLINSTLADEDPTGNASEPTVDAPNTPQMPSQQTSASSPLLSCPQNPQVDCYRLHGSLPQPTRTSILQSFTRTTTPAVLLATDVASRGLDLPSLDLVIEYDPAFSKEDHLHRIGRTARLGRDGRAIIFLMPGSEEGYIQILRDSYKSSADGAGTTVAGTTAEDVLRKGFTPSTGVVSNKADWETRATDLQLRIERLILADAALKDLARKAYQSHIRAYSTHVAAERVYFDLKALHLGHLAKGFGLRDAPGKVNVVGLRGVGKADRQNSKRPQKERQDGEAEMEKKARKTVAQKTERAEIDAVDDAESAAAKMRSMVRKRGGMLSGMAEEFNIA